MNKKNKKETSLNTITFGDVADMAYGENGTLTTGYIQYDYNTTDLIYTASTSATTTGSITFDTNNIYSSDSYGTVSWSDELADIKKEQQEDECLRNEHSVLQEAWNEYQLIKKLVQEEESDKYIKDKYKGFKE